LEPTEKTLCNLVFEVDPAKKKKAIKEPDQSRRKQLKNKIKE
jgi:hypothetical protein